MPLLLRPPVTHRCTRLAAVLAAALALSALPMRAQAADAAAGAASAPSAPVAAKQLPLWELGFGVAALRLPDYRGSDQSQRYALPLPYAIYRGEFLKADREGARAVLVDGQRFEIDVSVAAAVPARNNAAREGMPDLAPRVEIGPSANLDLYRQPDDRIRLRLQAPLRAAFTLERSFRDVGASFTPHLNLDLKEIAGGWEVGVQGGPIFASRRFHDYLYGVDAQYATVARPAYVARGGYAGWFALTGVSRRFNNTWVGAFARYDSLRGAVIAGSPLVRADHALTYGIGVAWVFAVSDQRVPADR